MLPQMTSAVFTSYTAPIFEGLSVPPSSVVSGLPLASWAGVTWPLTTWYLRILASSAWLCIMVIEDAGSWLNAVLAGAKTVTACIELSPAVSPAVLMSLARVVSSGLCEAAVTTGSMLMPWKLPMPVAGTIPQSDPNRADSAMAWWAIAWCDELAPEAAGAEDALLPQAAAVSATTLVMMPPTMVTGLPVLLVGLVRMVSPVLQVELHTSGGWPGSAGPCRVR